MRICRPVVLVAAFLGSGLASTWAADKTPLTPQQRRATERITEYLRRVTHQRADAALGDVRSLEDWKQRRPRAPPPPPALMC